MFTDAEIADGLRGDPERNAYTIGVELQLRCVEETMRNHRWWHGSLRNALRQSIANTRRNMEIIRRGRCIAKAD